MSLRDVSSRLTSIRAEIAESGARPAEDTAETRRFHDVTGFSAIFLRDFF